MPILDANEDAIRLYANITITGSVNTTLGQGRKLILEKHMCVYIDLLLFTTCFD
jgi:hypothetical protein